MLRRTLNSLQQLRHQVSQDDEVVDAERAAPGGDRDQHIGRHCEYPDWLLIRSERHLDRVLREFVEHYNAERPHRGINLEVPVPNVTAHRFKGVSNVQRSDRLGGLIHEYRVAT